MGRILLLGAVLLSALVVAGAALPAQTPQGNLGKPDEHSRTTGENGGLNVDVGPCAGFVTGNTLLFTGLAVTFNERFWQSASWEISRTTLTGSTTVGGFTYTVRAELRYDGPEPVDVLGSGKITITRSDGARISDDTEVGINFFGNPAGEWAYFGPESTCR
jgi:hypothetical protein